MMYVYLIGNPYPPYQEFDGINLLLTGLFISMVILYLMVRLYEWNRKRPKYIGDRKLDHWKRSERFYRVYCKIHGYYETYLQGREEELRCPKCIAERDGKHEG